MDSTGNNTLCPWMNLLIITEVNAFSVSLQKKGCEKYAGYGLGEIDRDGSHDDLSALGCNIFDWQNVRISIENRNAKIYINGEEAFNEVYKKDFGAVVGVVYIAEGTGSIDYVKLSGADGQTVFEDDFER